MLSAWTAFHAIELGFRTILIKDACRGISPEGIEDTFRKIKEANGLVVKSSEVKKASPCYQNCLFYLGKSHGER